MSVMIGFTKAGGYSRPCRAVFWIHWNKTQSIKEIIPEINFTQLLYLDGSSLVHADDVKAVKELMVNLYKEGKLGLLHDRLETAGEKYEGLHTSLLNEQDLGLTHYLRQLFHSYQELAGMWWLSIMIGDALQEYVIDAGIVTSEEEMIEKLANYHRGTWLERQSEEVVEFARKIKQELGITDPSKINDSWLADSGQLKTEVNDHVEEFSWFGTHHWMGDEYAVDTALSQIQDAMKKSGRAKTKGSKATADDDNNDMWKLLASVTYWRTHCAEVAAKVIFRSRDRLTECAERWGMTYEKIERAFQQGNIALSGVRRGVV